MKTKAGATRTKGARSTRTAAPRARKVLLTGATGFVGKVVLEELTRRAEELGIESVYVFVRPRKDRTAQHRFDKSIANSDCFSKRTDDWQRMCIPVGGELTHDDCGLSADDVTMLTENVTHVIHCAASVEFELPIAEAAAANITGSLNVLKLAQRCTRLKSMVSVSTAYVTPHVANDEPVPEALAALPGDAEDIYKSILDGTADEKALLRAAGLPNTYTFTKNVAEHLLMERRGNVPLTIVRPSMVSACFEHPFPGWIDSPSGFAGFVALCGAGYLRTVAADPRSRPDIVPCDVVSSRIVESAFVARPPKEAVRHAVAGQKNAQRVEQHIEVILDFFRKHPVERTPAMEFVGPPSPVFAFHEARLHRVPIRLAKMWYAVRKQSVMRRTVTGIAERLHFLNRAFSYFTTRTFDFQTKTLAGATETRFDPAEFTATVCLGVYRHLLRRDDTAQSLAGRAHRKESPSDVLWSFRQPDGNLTLRSLAVAVRKAMRHGISEVTFDRRSFESAVKSVKPGTRFVLVPTHRSYLDFVLVSYLCFARRDLGISIPHIAAAEEFSRIPVLGTLFRKGHAFYIKRGAGKADPQLTEQVNGLVADGATLEFFIEGARSRSRQFLPPKHGMLRCLQGTGETFALLPVAISYDRILEESSLLREVQGWPKASMQLRKLVRGIGTLARGEMALGRIHMTCGEPVMMSPDSDARKVSRAVMAELQRHTATTTHHLKSFLAKNPIPGVDLKWLRAAIEKRGGEVIDSPLGGEASVDATAERCMRYHWIHHFYGDAELSWPGHPAITHHTRGNSYAPVFMPTAAELRDPRLRAVLHALFEPIARDYATAATKLGSPEWAPRHASPRSVLYETPSAYLPNLQAAFSDLADRGVLALDESGTYEWGPNAAAIEEYREAVRWPESRTGEPVVEQREVGT